MVNAELDLAWNFVNNTDRIIFLTGKAGTGKTTFLHKLKLESKKRMVVVAPTGVAAINAKGVTIHSFFQLPFGPILPNAQPNTSNFNRRFSKTKINIIKSLDLLIIDEISMVRADVLDGIDSTLRRFKNRNLVFGGVQVLMIGDLQQLSPVVKDNEWQLLQQFYNTIFFFSSIAYQNCKPLNIELQHIYRQENPVFINILNEIRNNNLSIASANILNERYFPEFKPNKNDGFITLTTHNTKARQTNTEKLNSLKAKAYVYKAKVQGNFPEHAYPNTPELVLKVGTQVMFIKNDSSQDKRYYNGKIGTVIALDQNEVTVNCPDANIDIITKVETWENITYTVDSKTKAITEDTIGSYSQIPLRLAWAITIHKSQGLTFENAIIDAQGAFAHGQTYVALSRCKTLEGLILKSKIEHNQIINDIHVTNFNKNAEANKPNETVLKASQRDFQLHLISEIFDFYNLLNPTLRILDIFYKNRNSIKGDLETPLNTIKETVKNLLKISQGFKAQLQALIGDIELPEANTSIQERFKKAITYFENQTTSNIEAEFKKLNFTTDNKAIEHDIEKQLDIIEELVIAKQIYFKGLKEGFNSQSYLTLRAKSVFIGKDKTKKQRKTIIDGTANVELFELLRTLRNQIAEHEDLVLFQIFTQKSLYAMCELLPTTTQQLKAIHGMGKTRIEKYGDAILNVIINYCKENDIDTSYMSSEFEVTSSKSKSLVGNTKKTSLELFKSGKSIDQIALERELTSNTIFGHLASFIDSGEVTIKDLMSESHYTELKKLIPTKTFEGLSDLKHQLDEKYSYEELRLVINVLSNEN